MCFEWDERYRRERAARLSKEKVDELVKRSEEAVKTSQDIPASSGKQSAKEREEVAT